MLLVDDILLFPVNGILWVVGEIGKIAHEELAGESQLITEQLRLLYMQLETGRITEAQFEIEEKLLLDRLDLIESRLQDEEDLGEPDVTTTDDKHDQS